MIPAFPGATGAQAKRPLWGVVMSVTAFDAIPADDPAALRTLNFLRQNKDPGGLHYNLGYSNGVWPYMSACVALWHARVGEFDEAWRVLRAFAAHASPTACWYEEQERRGVGGYGDPAATFVHLTRKLLVWDQGDDLYICPGLPPDLMAAGKGLSLQGAPTTWGKCSFTLRWHQGGATAEIQLPKDRRPARIRVCLAPDAATPWQALEVTGAKSHARQGRDVVLTSPQEKVTIRAGTQRG
jgi:hypothetical protein